MPYGPWADGVWNEAVWATGMWESGAPSVLTITTTFLPPAIVGEAYTATLTATGGTPAYTWSVVTGSLPAWATLNASTGVITGTPSGAATTSFTVRVTDALSATDDQPLSITASVLTALGSARSGAGSLVAAGVM